MSASTATPTDSNGCTTDSNGPSLSSYDDFETSAASGNGRDAVGDGSVPRGARIGATATPTTRLSRKGGGGDGGGGGLYDEQRGNVVELVQSEVRVQVAEDTAVPVPVTTLGRLVKKEDRRFDAAAASGGTSGLIPSAMQLQVG